jgi:hypothetical protein
LAQKSDADNVSALFDSNVTRGALKNLLTDKPAPITTKLAQKSDADNVSALFDSNVTRGALKNLLTDKPAPITTKLAQKSDADNLSALFDSNVTRGALKNLVTDKPAPITTKLAQTMVNMEKNSVTDKQSLAQGVPVHVNPVIMRDTMGDAKLDMDIKVGPDELSLLKKKQAGQSSQVLSEKQGVPVHVNPVIARDTMGDADLGMQMRVGMDEVSVAKKAPKKNALAQLENPVYNPPWNNWSVNQPSPPHAHGLAGREDLGQNIIVDGHAVHY